MDGKAEKCTFSAAVSGKKQLHATLVMFAAAMQSLIIPTRATHTHNPFKKKKNHVTKMSAANTKLDYSAGVHKDMGGATADVVTMGEFDRTVVGEEQKKS